MANLAPLCGTGRRHRERLNTRQLCRGGYPIRVRPTFLAPVAFWSNPQFCSLRREGCFLVPARQRARRAGRADCRSFCHNTRWSADRDRVTMSAPKNTTRCPARSHHTALAAPAFLPLRPLLPPRPQSSVLLLRVFLRVSASLRQVPCKPFVFCGRFRGTCLAPRTSTPVDARAPR